jgi:hypothetical protein
MKGLFVKLIIGGMLTLGTVMAYGGSFKGWFLPEQLEKPVSLRDGSTSSGTRALGYYFIGRRHVGGGYRGGK